MGLFLAASKLSGRAKVTSELIKIGLNGYGPLGQKPLWVLKSWDGSHYPNSLTRL